jgi:hypothetical protein
MSDYDKGYRAGVMAERRRAMLVALRAVNPDGRPSEEGHSLAHQIGRAGNQIPAPVPEEPEEWTVFGERRLVKDLPSLLESTRTPFTKAGLQYIHKLEDKHYARDVFDERAVLLNDHDDRIHIEFLKEQLADAPERIAELEKIVETLSLQLTGIID